MLEGEVRGGLLVSGIAGRGEQEGGAGEKREDEEGACIRILERKTAGTYRGDGRS
jgi:hypothetical protein